MSHTETVKVEVKDRDALIAAVQSIEGAAFVRAGCERHTAATAREKVDTTEEATGQHAIYSGTYEGIGVILPGWNYPVIINPETGEIKYDNYNGHWGSQDGLDRLVQGYSVEQIRLEAIRQGVSVAEETLENGDIRLLVNDYRE